MKQNRLVKHSCDRFSALNVDLRYARWRHIVLYWLNTSTSFALHLSSRCSLGQCNAKEVPENYMVFANATSETCTSPRVVYALIHF